MPWSMCETTICDGAIRGGKGRRESKKGEEEMCGKGMVKQTTAHGRQARAARNTVLGRSCSEFRYLGWVVESCAIQSINVGNVYTK